MHIITRQEVIALGLKRYCTGKPCKNGHIAERYVTVKACLECNKTWQKSRNQSTKLAKWKRWYARNREREIEKSKERSFKWYKENKARRLEKAKIWERDNKDKRKIQKARYKKEKPWVNANIKAKRRAAEKQAIPKWIGKDGLDAIKQFYKNAKKLGSTYHVDHIIPLQGENVCGLHVPWNLQVIDGRINQSKGNKYAA